MGESEFLQVFGDITVSDIMLWVLAIGVAGPHVKNGFNWLRRFFLKTENNETALSNAGKLPEWHQQSVDIRAELQRQIEGLQKAVDGINERLDKKDKADQEKRLNKTYSQIIQMFQFYTSEERNPMQAWTAMEADAFWKIIRDYEDDGGDGYVHTEIVPPMRQLLTIEMSDRDGIRKLMQSRR